MNFLRLFCILFFYFIISNSSVFAKSPVWQISKNGNHLFIGGTFHLLNQSDYPLPEPFEFAYNNSRLLVLETDLQKISSPEFQQTMMQKVMYTKGETLKNFLDVNTLETLKTHLKSRGIPLEPMLKFKPGFLTVTLTMIELQRLGLVGTGVDQFYSLKALNEKRTILHLETVNEQLEFISSMGEGNENSFILYSLADLKNLPELFASMKNAWRNGENEQLQAVALAPLKDKFPKVYNSLLVQRNNCWMPKIKTMLKTKEVEYILVGALHLVGEEGILQQLKDAGYTVTNL